MIGIQDESVVRAVDSALVERRSNLRREREVGRRPFILADDDPQLIDNIRLTDPLEKRACKSMRDHMRRVGGEELRNSGNSVADHVLQQLAWQPPDPMAGISKNGAGIALSELV